MYRRAAPLVVLFLIAAGFTLPQSNSPQTTQSSTQQTAQPSQSPAPAPADQPPKPAADAAANPAPAAGTQSSAPAKGSVNGNKIPSGSHIYVAPMGGFESYVVAGILKKKVPVVIVADRDKAEYEIKGSAETEHAGWAKMLFMGSQNSNEQASINVTEIKSGTVVFAYSVNKLNSYKGKQSAGEAIGKHLNEAIGKD